MPDGISGFVASETYERHRLEDRRTLDDLEGRLMKLEHGDVRVDERLKHITGSVDDVKHSVEKTGTLLEKLGPQPLRTYLPIIISIVVVALGWAATVARSPDRDDIRALQSVAQQALSSALMNRTIIDQLKETQAEIRLRLQALEAARRAAPP